ncbi:hypothetical protein ABC345_09350 [Shouchella sp. 1P09AA]|uniref:hypothetical protein n=1 Tax=unclassified Shouchella TaxID=2893065 RepID=UPI0039A3C32C
MAITIPVPGLGNVSVLTGPGDSVSLRGCQQFVGTGETVIQVSPTALFNVFCPNGNAIRVVYLTNLQDLNLINLIEQILDLNAQVIEATTEITTLVAV